jgi:hypothetical protein
MFLVENPEEAFSWAWRFRFVSTWSRSRLLILTLQNPILLTWKGHKSLKTDVSTWLMPYNFNFWHISISTVQKPISQLLRKSRQFKNQSLDMPPRSVDLDLDRSRLSRPTSLLFGQNCHGGSPTLRRYQEIFQELISTLENIISLREYL